MKNTLKIISMLAVLACFAGPSFAQQYTLSQTTLSAKAGAGDTQIQVASATGIYGYAANLTPIPANPTNPQTHCYIDREELEIRSISGTVAQVRRGVNGTTGQAHASGQMVLCGPITAFYTMDPGGTPGSPGGSVSGVACTSTNVYVTPWVNVRTGAQWICSTITSTWIPGFGNSAAFGNMVPNTAVNSATAAMVPTGPLFHVTGTSTMTSITEPLGCNATAVGGCTFVVIPDSTAVWTAGNNISNSVTATAGNPMLFVWDAVNSKWYIQTY